MCHGIKANATQPPDYIEWFPNRLLFQLFDEERGVVPQKWFPFSNSLVTESNPENFPKPGMIGVIRIIKESSNTAWRCKFPFSKLPASSSSVGAVDVLLGDLADVG